MGSRRTTPRLSYGSGRSSSSGDESNGNGSSNGQSNGRRSTSCSYLSNVRADHRSTLCSVMAQLTEEKQPSFETTLKSKAVSENCNVKFSCVVTGSPTPQLTWYKDDKQMDRFCGLPKYEIFRNGQNHSLHIYNCSTEDAAIYQASAGNSKGIVSCSGVLEVGEMNEFKIHQRYFGKLKQKAENKRIELEGKENQEPLRTISPDRTLRKRRSTTEAFLSTPSSPEDELIEESNKEKVVKTEPRLTEGSVEVHDEKQVPITNGVVSGVSNGQASGENVTTNGTYIYDSAQKVFTAQQQPAKTHFVKKKIKISNDAKVAKSDMEDARGKTETSAVNGAKKTQSKVESEEVMEVENSVGSSILDSGSRNLAKQRQGAETERVSRVESPLRGETKRVEVAMPSQKEQPPPKSLTVSAYDAKKVPNLENKAIRKDLQVPTPPQRRKKERVTVMEVDKKTDISKSGSVKNGDVSGSVNAPCESSKATLIQQIPDQMSAKEASQKNVGVSRPPRRKEVTQAQTKMTRNDAPVNSKTPPNAKPTVDVQPLQKDSIRTLERQASIDDTTVTPNHHHSSQRGLQAPLTTLAPGTRDHSRGLNESRTGLHTDPEKSPPVQSSAGLEKNTLGQRCSVSPNARQQRQVDTAIKTVAGSDIMKGVGEKVEGSKVGSGLGLSSLSKTGKIAKIEIGRTEIDKTKDMAKKVAKDVTIDKTEKKEKTLNVKSSVFEPVAVPHATKPPGPSKSGSPNEKIVEMEIEQTEIDKTKDMAKKVADVHITDVSIDKTEKKENTLNLKSTVLEPAAVPLMSKPSENTTASDFKEIPKVATRVISIAELLRAQIKALESSLEHSFSTIPAQTTAAAIEPSEKAKESAKICDIPLRNLRETLMEVYHQLNLDGHEEIEAENAALALTQASQKPPVIPPISVIDTGANTDNVALQGNAKIYNQEVIDVCKENKVSNLGPSNDSGSENAKLSFSPSNSGEGLTNGSITNLSGSSAAVKASSENQNLSITDLERAKDAPVQGKGIGLMQNSTPDITLDRKTDKEIAGNNSTTLQDRSKMDEQNTKNVGSSSESVQNPPAKNEESGLQVIQQDSAMVEEDSTSNSTLEASPLIPSATPQELALGARRKIPISKAKTEEILEVTPMVDTQKKEVPTPTPTPSNSKLSTSPVGLGTSPNLSRRSQSLQTPVESPSPTEKRSPLVNRRKVVPDTQTQKQPVEETHSPKPEAKPAEKDKHDPFKAPQVIRKIRGESFSDSSGHLKLWCQFFNVLSDSTIQWFKNEERIAQIKRNAGDETQVNLAIVQATYKDAGVYGCSITNDYGTDSTDFLLSSEIVAGMCIREDLSVGEEIEVTPLVFSKGVGDSGVWGNKLFGRVMVQESRIGDGCAHKAWRAKVIYGLEPLFESGQMCVIKTRNPVAYGGKGDASLIDRNMDVMRQECKMQMLAREYCKIFSAESRVMENFGPALEVVPVYLMYRPANTVPYASVESELTGMYQQYSVLYKSRIITRTSSVVEQKCCALQHWIYQWTSGNLLFTRIEGIDTKLTGIGISVKNTGHQGLTIEGDPKVFEYFVTQHQCNYFCGLLSLRSLKLMDSLSTPTKSKSSRSPLLQRKTTSGSSSPQTGRKNAASPRMPRKTEQDGRSTPTKQKATDAPQAVKME